MPEQLTASGGERETRYPWLLHLCAATLLAVTFSVSGRGARDTLATLDVIALLKFGTRVAVFLALVLLAAGRLRGSRRGAKVVRRLLPLVPFGVWCGASILWSAKKAVSMGQFFSLVVLFMMLLVNALCVDSEARLKMVVRSLARILIVASAVILLLFFFVPSLHVLQRQGTGILHPTNAGATASLGLMLVFVPMVIWRADWSFRLVLPALLIHGTVLLLAHNRVSLALAVGLPVLAGITRLRPGWWCAGALAANVLFLALLFADPGLKSLDAAGRSVSVFVRREQSQKQLRSFSGRGEMWAAMWKSHRQSPWRGHGYFVTSERGQLKVWQEWGNWTAHSLYLQCLTTTGLIGVCLFVGGIGTLLASLAQRSLTGPAPASYLVLAGFFVTWYALWGLFNSSILGPIQPESVVFATLSGALLGAAHAGPSDEPSGHEGSSATREVSR